MRNYLMELLGTFFLTMALTFTGNPVAIGVMLVGLMYIGRHVSGGHFNPAISLAEFTRGRMKLEEFFIYCAMQSVGAIAGLGLFTWITGNTFSPEAITDVVPSMVFIVETVLVGLFALLWITVTSGTHFKASDIYGLAIGLGFMAILFIGGLYNPAVAIASLIYNLSIGVEIIGREMAVYIGAPLLGAVLGALSFDYFNKRGGK